MSTASLKLGTLIVRVERGRELGGTGKSSSILSSKSRLDPFVAVSLTSSDEQRTSPAVGGGRFPSWEHCPSLKFHLSANARSTLHIDVYDQRTMGGDKKLGRAIVNFAPLLTGAKTEIHEWFPLMSEKSGESKGEVRAKIAFEHEQHKHDTVVINFGAQPSPIGQAQPVALAQPSPQPMVAPVPYPSQLHQPPIMYYATGGPQPISPNGQYQAQMQPQTPNAYPPTNYLHYPPQAPMQILMPGGAGVSMQPQQQYPPNVMLPPNGAAPALPATIPQHQVFASSAPYPPMMTTTPITHHQQLQQPPLDPNLYPPPLIQQQQQQYVMAHQQQMHSGYPPQQHAQTVSSHGAVVPPLYPGQGSSQPQPQRQGYYPY